MPARASMKAKSVAALLKRTINLGNFESVSVEAHLWAEVEDGADAPDALAQAFEMVTEEVHLQFKPFQMKPSSTVVSKFAGKEIKGG